MRISDTSGHDCRKLHTIIPAILFALVCTFSSFSVFRNVNDWQIVGKWIGFAISAGLAVVTYSIYGLFGAKGKTLQAESRLCSVPIILSAVNVSVAVTCLLQYAGILKSTSSFPMTSDFDNPAGVAALLCVTVPFSSTAFRSVRHNTLCFLSIAALDFTVLLLSQSRSGIIGISVCTSAYLYCTIRNRPGRIIILFVLILLSSISLILLFKCKSGSTSGRMTILNVCIGMIRERPLLGYGPGGFAGRYMLFQADYLSHVESDELRLLADNITHPLCGYLLIAVNYGILGLVLVLLSITGAVLFVVKRCARYRLPVLMTIGSVCILSMFSYPFKYPMTVVSLIVCLLYIAQDTSLHFPNSRFANIALLLSVTAAILPSVSWYRAQTMWKSVTDELENDTTCAIEARKKAIPETDPVLCRNARYLYSRGAVNYYAGNLEESLADLLTSSTAVSSYDTELLLGKVYNELGNHESAAFHWNLASGMCPSRMKPKYFLFKLYEQLDDTVRMLNIGKEMLEMPVKIPSSDTRSMRLEVRRKLFGM